MTKNNKITSTFLSKAELALINGNWAKENLETAKNEDIDSFLILSADRKSAWLITKNSKDYDYAYDSVEELVDDLVKQNDYNLKPVAKKLGVSVKDLWANRDKAIDDIIDFDFGDNSYALYVYALLKDSE